MLMVMLCVLQLREVLHPRFMAQQVKPQEAHNDLLESLVHETVPCHMRRIASSVGIYLVLLLFFVLAPVVFVKWAAGLVCGDADSAGGVCGGSFKLVTWYAIPALQLPLEFIFWHVVMLSVTEWFKDSIGHFQHWWLVWSCRRLGLTRFLLPLPHAFKDKSGHPRSQGEEGEAQPAPQQAPQQAPHPVPRQQSGDAIAEGPADATTTDATTAAAPEDAAVLHWAKDGHREDVLHDDIAHKFSRDHEAMRVELDVEELSGGEADRVMRQHLLHDYEYGPPMQRPPNGWELNAQSSRWAHGDERKSQVEKDLAPRFVPDHWALRVWVLCSASWLLTLVLFIAAALMPVALGRLMTATLRLPVQYRHDPIHLVLGCKLIYSVYSLVMWCYKNSESDIAGVVRKFPRLAGGGGAAVLVVAVARWVLLPALAIGANLRCLSYLVCKVAAWMPHVAILSKLLSGNVSGVEMSHHDNVASGLNILNDSSSSFSDFALSLVWQDLWQGVCTLAIVLSFLHLFVGPDAFKMRVQQGAAGVDGDVDNGPAAPAAAAAVAAAMDEHGVPFPVDDNDGFNVWFEHWTGQLHPRVMGEMTQREASLKLAQVLKEMHRPIVAALLPLSDFVQYSVMSLCLRLYARFVGMTPEATNTYLLLSVYATGNLIYALSHASIAACFRRIEQSIRNDCYLVGTRLLSSVEGGKKLEELRVEQDGPPPLTPLAHESASHPGHGHGHDHDDAGGSGGGSGSH